MKVELIVHAFNSDELQRDGSPAQVEQFDNQSTAIDDSTLLQVPVLQQAFIQALSHTSSNPTSRITMMAGNDGIYKVDISMIDADSIMKLTSPGKLVHGDPEQAKNTDNMNLLVDKYDTIFKYHGNYYYVNIREISVL